MLFFFYGILYDLKIFHEEKSAYGVIHFEYCNKINKTILERDNEGDRHLSWAYPFAFFFLSLSTTLELKYFLFADYLLPDDF